MSETSDKGKFLEDIVTHVHRVNGLQATPRVRLPAKTDPTRSREIDVMLEAMVGPYPVQFPIECKNWGDAVSIGEIDSFEGKLNDIGLNVRGAIYVSASGYASGAISKAKSLGIVLLEPDGLSESRLSQELHNATSAALYMFPSVQEVKFESTHTWATPVLQDRKGNMGGFVLDLIWKHWIETLELQLGLSAVTVDVPAGWGNFIAGEFSEINRIEFTIIIEGHLLATHGIARKAILKSAESGKPVIGHVGAEYESPLGKFDLKRLTSEDDLKAELGSNAPLLISLARIKTPRVLTDGNFGRFAWLPSDFLIEQLLQSFNANPDAYSRGEGPRIEEPDDIGSFFALPSQRYASNLRRTLGATWNPTIWDSVIT